MDLEWDDQEPLALDEDSFQASGRFSSDDRITFINSFDYNLNSPLISDDVNYLQDRISGRPVPAIWTVKDWGVPIQVGTRLKVNWNPVTHHHIWLGRWLLHDQIDTTQGVAFLQQIDQESESTYPIVSTFLRGWIGTTVPYPRKLGPRTHKKIFVWAQKFLDLHKIILLLNCVSKREQDSLVETCKCTRLDDSISIRTPSLGVAFLSLGFVFLPEHRVILDRNFVLMIKDIVIARLQTLLAITNRVDRKFLPGDIHHLVEIYSIGDRILASCGSAGYDVIKMVEPLCNERMCSIARTYRDLIPEFPKFREHIDNTIEALRGLTPLAVTLRDTIRDLTGVELILTVYGAFRHWGHPYIDYMEGLAKLHNQVTTPKEIDVNYAEALASDMAKLVLHKMFQSKKKWFVDPEKVPRGHPLLDHIQGNTWPTPAQILDFGDNWHRLPLVKCFDIPDLIEPSIIYADKSHSMDRSQVLAHVQNHPTRPIPTKKVMKTVLEREATNWPEFLQEVDEVGLKEEDLVIGLKAKERELKTAGRFFSLMSWRLREYFVITEYLIKTHFVPLFHGLTMADDLTSVIKKIMDSSSGQGRADYSKMTISNHIDYEKWNNHQRGEANNPVFRVMGQFLGYPKLIERTHEFFQKSIVYYNGRPDLMYVRDGALENRGNQRVCWNGQDGGLEGLRQKGWSIVNLLVIARESKIRNTSVKTLAQGDNQVICTHYKVRSHRDDRELVALLQQICKNNAAIMSAIEEGTGKLGLLINNDETMQSADYLNYGKIPIFRGVVRGLECKRWSRVTCVTNDQLPTCANLMSSVSTNALTVAHFDVTPVNAMIHYNYFGNFARILMELHNPAMRSPLSSTDLPYNTWAFKVAVLYLDPSLGGVCGTALSRFLIRSFPDPVTESLAFWKFIHHHTQDEQLRKLAIEFGNPDIAVFRPDHVDKLLEDPTSLNIAMGMSPTNLIKTKIKESLVTNRHQIRNKIVQDAIIHLHQDDQELRSFLWSIDPLFPRFISEFKSGTFMGVADSVISLFQNSRTIRSSFRSFMSRELDQLIYQSERSSLAHLCKYSSRGHHEMWRCSSSHADALRRRSWGRKVLGVTIPHPLEMHGPGTIRSIRSRCCDHSTMDYISVHCVGGMDRCLETRGPLGAYMGSKTSESTSILQPWERETKIPLIRRATRLRDAIHWFIDPDSRLASSILNNLKALTGEDWAGSLVGFKRTGSALHRFSTTRMSHGGFAAQSPAALTRLLATTDTMSDLNQANYDFMYQASLLYAQMTSSVLLREQSTEATMHYHINCRRCVREIEEPRLESTKLYDPRSVAVILRAWRNNINPWGESKLKFRPRIREWGRLSSYSKSFHIGRAIGFLFGDLTNQKMGSEVDSSIFPLSLQNCVHGAGFLKGMLDGLIRASGCQVIHRYNVQKLKRPANSLYGGIIYLIYQLSRSPQFGNLCRSGPIRVALDSIPHKVPPSYPTSNSDMGLSIRNYFQSACRRFEEGSYTDSYTDLWLFSDTVSLDFAGPLALSSRILRHLYRRTLSRSDREELRKLGMVSSALRCGDLTEDAAGSLLSEKMFLCPEEIRHAGKGIDTCVPAAPPQISWGREWVGSVNKIEIFFAPTRHPNILWSPPRIQNPSVSGLRTGQLPTGAHYKIRTIVVREGIRYRDFLCGGDGSGGMTAALLRINRTSRAIFNSLMVLDEANMRGASPDPPNALLTLGSDHARCVNWDTCWEEPSDLMRDDTWSNFHSLKERFHLNIELMVFDMETVSSDITNIIAKQLRSHVSQLLAPGGCVIFKTYGTMIAGAEVNPVTILGPLFQRVHLVQTNVSSSHTSEIYLVCRQLVENPVRAYPIWGDIRVFWENMFAFRSYDKELDRAHRLYQEDLTIGVPPIFLPTLLSGLEVLLQQGNVPGGVAHHLSRLVLDHSLSDVDASVILMSATSYYTINHIRRSPAPAPPPSDGALAGMAAAWVGIGLFLAISRMDLRLYQMVLGINNRSFPVRINPIKRKEEWTLQWRCKGSGVYTKDCRVTSSQAMVGQWLRHLSRFRYKVSPLNPHRVDRILSEMSDMLFLRDVLNKTGLRDFLKYDIDLEDRSVPYAEVGEDKDRAIAWTE
ncbi:RNA-dependent RNA polymerase [Wufeng Myotis altarium vesiculovirus 1]|uniref:RNA-dependent RNA polymerase n=1 Tax=Wufeng Myotis altarium vesiculovirus 1 TaxID=2929011 RepID=UPI002481AAAE|nr:RNA-dependent RNA polymerase [Wufeng Myotis altarium vesiculovirus 1]UOX72934.1 RNA-dependent RNA polymerase [Wufeng Myotis altarium vesiculovirus 1]